MSNLDWAIFIVIAIAALTQLYFGSKYRHIFVIGSTTINKSLISQIRHLNHEHPTAGKLYILLLIVQLLSFVAIAANSHSG